jgi:succinyl-CoA synthetase alpha subunit
MAVFANAQTRVIVQGITGREGAFHTESMIKAGTQIVGGVTPGKGGEWMFGKPIFDTMRAAVNATDAQASVIFVPPTNTLDAIFEAVDAGIKLIVSITEGMPVQDMLRTRALLKGTGTRLIGPNCPGLLIPGRTRIGVIPNNLAIPGHVGVVSRSGSLMYEVLNLLTGSGIGQSSCIGIGGDPMVGTPFRDVLEAFENDPDTEKIVLIGEIGGHDELVAAEYIASHVSKPVVAIVVGRHAPTQRKLGHVGAMITDERSSASHKIAALKAAGVVVVDVLEEIPLALG